jgi:hypothetical protein
MVAAILMSALCMAQSPPGTRLSDDEVAIYGAYLKPLAKNSKATIHLANRPVAISGAKDQRCITSNGIVFPGDGAAGEAFDAALIKGLDDVELVDAEAQKAIVRANDPKRLPAGFNDEQRTRAAKAASDASLYTLSRIGFDKAHRFAALQYTIYCGEKCGNIEILIFEKVKGKWQWTGRFCGRLIA